jgi:protein TonB
MGPGSGGGTGGGAYQLGGSVTAPRTIYEVAPTYSAEALGEGIQGSVVIELVVTRAGNVDRLRVVRSLDAGLDEEAVKAVRQWRFEPGRLAGIPVDVVVTVIVEFAIR